MNALSMFGKSGVYRITNSITAKHYVGSTKDLGKRRSGHLRQLKRGKHPNQYLQHAYDKYGEDAFAFVVIEECSVDVLVEREQFWIDEFDSANHKRGYNVCPRADRKAHGESTKDKLRIAATGFVHSEDTKLRISKAMRGRPKDAMSIKKRQETKRANGTPGSMTGRRQSEFQKQRVREALKGNQHFKGKRLSEDHKAKLLMACEAARIPSHKRPPRKGTYNGAYSAGNRFQARIYINGRFNYLGRYDTEPEAAAAYNAEAIKAFGPDCYLNQICQN